LTYGQWEGRDTINLAWQYLYFIKNPSSKYVAFMTDDAVFYSILGTGRLDCITSVITYSDKKYQIFITDEHSNPVEKIPYEKMAQFTHAHWTENYPIVSDTIMQHCNLSTLTSCDSYFSLLRIILLQRYKIEIGTVINHFAVRFGENIRRPWGQFGYSAPTCSELPIPILNSIEQTAKNIYLNIKEDGLLHEYTV
jgi:hypothetical protein